MNYKRGPGELNGARRVNNLRGAFGGCFAVAIGLLRRLMLMAVFADS